MQSSIKSYIKTLGRKMRAENGLYKGEPVGEDYVSAREALNQISERLALPDGFEELMTEYLEALFERLRLQEYVESGAGSAIELFRINKECETLVENLCLSEDECAVAQEEAELLAAG